MTMAMWGDMPPLVDSRQGGMIPPPPNAAMEGHPAFHSAFPGFQPQPQQAQPPPNWWQGGAVQGGTPWAGAGASFPNGAPGQAGPSWANTPLQPSPWQQHHQQQQQQTPPWAPVMPRQGWGPPAQGMGTPWDGHSGPSTPWGENWGQPPHHSARTDGFSATAAPPETEQPIGPSWFNMGRGGGGGGMHPGMHGDPMSEPWDEENEEWNDARDPRAMEGWTSRPAWAQQDWGHELMRTHSQGRPKSPGHKKKKKRANSFPGGQLQGGWGTPAVFDENHLSRRPEDWRDGYSPRGISGADLSFSSLFRVGKKSDPNEWTGDTRKRTLAPVLSYNVTRPNISYDLRRSPEETPYMGYFQPRSQREMFQPACTPPAVRMRLMHPRLPWFVDVVAGYHSAGVTLLDVLRTLFDELNRPIQGRDFWNEELGKRDREILTRAFKERCMKKGEYMQEEMLKGVKRVDFLGVDCVFVGLVRRNGLWEIKTESDH